MMKYKQVAHMMSKQAYGGDLVGDGTSYYDRANFYSIDPEWDEPDVLSDKRRYKDTVKSMQEYAKDIRDAANIYNIDGAPVTSIVLSKQEYNEGDNIDGLAWADKVDAAIAAKDPNAIYDLASYGYAWYGTDKGKNLNPMRALRMDSQGRIMQSGDSKGALIGLGVVGGVGLLAALACYGKEKGWFNGMQKKQSLQKAADYYDSLSHDFYDPYYVGTEDRSQSLKQYKRYYKALNKMFSKVYKGKHGWGYEEAGLDEKGKTQNIFVEGMFDGLLSYADWKKNLETAIKNKDIDTANDLTWVTGYHVLTDSPKKTYGDLTANIGDLTEDQIRQLYANSPALNSIIRIRAKQNELQKQYEATEAEQDSVLDPIYDENDVVEQEENRDKNLQALSKRIDKTYERYSAAMDANKPQDVIDKYKAEFDAASAAYDAAYKPYDARYMEIDKRYRAAAKPYWKALDALERRIGALSSKPLTAN